MTDLGLSNPATNVLRPILNVLNGIVILTNRVGANGLTNGEYQGNLYPNPPYGSTNGSPLQWQFFSFSNINYNVTNTVLYGTNAYNYTNAIFATFLPLTQTLPNSSPPNLSYPAANNADVDLYVSTNPALFDLDPVVLAGAAKSVGQGGSETVFYTNISSISNFYIGVKSESQQGGEFAFFAVVTTNFDSSGDGIGLDGDTPVIVPAYGLPVVIPDSDDANGQVGAYAIAFVASPITVRKVMAVAGVEHGNPADLYGTLSHQGQTAAPNHLTGAPGGFTNAYDDLQDGTTPPLIPQADGTTYAAPIIDSDGPGTLLNFVGQPGAGQWILNERDNILNQTGWVTTLTLLVWPQPPFSGSPGGLISTNYINLAPYGSYYGYVDVPNDGTNLNIALTNLPNGDGPFGIYLTNREVPNTGDYGTNPVNPPNGALNLSVNPALNLLSDPALPAAPPLSAGRWYYDITNESKTALTNIEVVISILESLTPNLNVTVYSPDTPKPLGTDDHTDSQICVTNGIFTVGQQLASLQVGVRLNDPSADNLALHLISPQGTSMLLFENRGGPLATNLGLTTANSNYVYLTFTDNADLAQQLIKFYPAPYGQLPFNVNAFGSSFETVSAGDYGQYNALLPIIAPSLEGWTVLSNDVAVVAGSDLYPANDGTNYLALANGFMTATIPTVVGQTYTLTNVYRGPGLLDWWPFEGDFDDIIGANNGTLTGGLVTNVTGEVGQSIQFPATGATINFGPGAGNFGTNDFTIDYWMSTTSTNAAEAFLQQGSACGGVSFWDIVASNGVPSMSVFDAASGQGPMTLTCAGPLTNGLWHHLAWTRSGNNYSLYVDGLINAGMAAGISFNLSNGQPLLLGTNGCAGIQPFTGAVDELDLWNRALTDVEIAAICQAGTNHIGKATPTSIFPNCDILIASGTNTITNTLIATNAGGTNWLTNTLYFTAFGPDTTVALQGNPLGMLLDNFVLQTPADLNYVQPEEPLAPFNGQNPYGCWTLDVWDTRTDSSALTNGTLLSWYLQMTVSSTNVNLIVLTNGVAYTSGTVAPNNFAYFAFDVPAGASVDTNILFNCQTNGSPAFLSLLFNQTALPTGTQLGDFTLLTNVTGGTNMLASDTPPPSLTPGARYLLGVQNSNSLPATFSILVDAPVFATAAAVIPLPTNSPYTNIITAAPQYYSFFVPDNAVLASFEIINPTNEVDLYARHALPLPSSTTFDYAAAYEGTNDAAIVVGTNSYPVPLTPGATWYLAVYNANTNNANTYQVLANYVLDGGITITPLADSLATAGAIGPGPDLTNFYSFQVVNPGAAAVQFVVSNMSGNVDLIAGNGYLPTPQQMTDGSFNPGTNLQLITIVTNAVLPSLVGTTWYLGVPNNSAGSVNYTIAATTLVTSSGYNFPAVALTAMSVGAGGFTLRWTTVPGAQYEVDMSSDLTHWTKAAALSTGAFTDPDLQQCARFYIVFRTQ